MGNKRVDNVQLNQQSQWLEPSGPKSLVEERDACGVGFIADQQGRASHRLVADALHALSTEAAAVPIKTPVMGLGL